MGWDDPLEKKMETHSGIPAWLIPWTEEAGGLQSIGLQRVRHDLMTKQQQSLTITLLLMTVGISPAPGLCASLSGSFFIPDFLLFFLAWDGQTHQAVTSTILGFPL